MMGFPRLALSFLTLAVVAGAQEYRARVQGLVTDPTRAAIVGAKVTLMNVNTAVESAKETDGTGRYLFEFVQPGTYTVTVEVSGFNRFVQENITVLTRGDVTVNAELRMGAVTETVTVTGQVAAVQFTTSTMTTTVVGNMLQNLPVLARNPFTLALLNPAVINRYWDVAHRNPFYMWSSNGLDVGGRTGGKNDMLLDGAPLGISARGSYNAPMDAVQEVAVQQNAVDAEFGFSAGGVLNISMKSGTNDFHGTAYYFGRNPKLNAITNRISRSKDVVKNNTWGATTGGPILKNRLFFFQSYEQWRNTQPREMVATLPTDTESTGDFSRSFTPAGAVRVIYDPYTTKFDPATATVTRTPFPGNILPKAQMDPTGVKIMNDLWKPNNPGNDITGIDNYKISYPWWVKYWNISSRVDYNISDNWRLYTRFSKYETRLDNPNHGGTIAVRSDNGGVMDALNAVADVLYLMSPRTTINLRYGATYVEDDYDPDWSKVPESVWANLFPTGWYEPVLAALGKQIFYPNFNFSGNGSASAGVGSWWLVRGRSHNPQVNVTHDRGMHHMKFGWALRYSYDQNGQPGSGAFSFNAVDTGDTFLGHDPKLSGNMYASLLLGVLDSGTAYIRPMVDSHQRQVAAFFQDDLRLTRRITLNLGLRYEYETAPSDYNRIYSRYLDLTNPIPEFQPPPAMPPEVTAIANIPYKWNGAWVFTDDDNPGIYPPQKTVFLPRIGVAVRINDQTAFRAGCARYSVPILTIHPETWNIPKDGFARNTSVLVPVQGVPQTRISDPFPAANPLQLPVGKALGRYTNLGDGTNWFNQDLVHPINDRLNFSFQRQLPFRLITDTTFFMNFGRDVQDASMWGGDYGLPVNLVDPNLYYTHKGAMDKAVPNPFYLLLPADKMPGVLRNRSTVPVGELLRPYPHYGSLNERFVTGKDSHYYSLQFKVERPMAQGISFVFGYNYSREARGEWFDDVARYQNRFTMIDTRDARHHVRLAGTWEVPLGRGRRYLSTLHPVLDAVVGGWGTSHILFWQNGPLLTFGAMVAPPANPKIDNPTRNRWFDTSGFAILPSYTPRTNPWYYDGLRGPGFWSMDSTISKYFSITERVKFELRMEFYNMPNALMPSQPEMSVASANFGKSTWIAGGNYGRELQYTGRIHF